TGTPQQPIPTHRHPHLPLYPSPGTPHPSPDTLSHPHHPSLQPLGLPPCPIPCRCGLLQAVLGKEERRFEAPIDFRKLPPNYHTEEKKQRRVGNATVYSHREINKVSRTGAWPERPVLWAFPARTRVPSPAPFLGLSRSRSWSRAGDGQRDGRNAVLRQDGDLRQAGGAGPGGEMAGECGGAGTGRHTRARLEPRAGWGWMCGVGSGDPAFASLTRALSDLRWGSAVGLHL
uniref:Uncharacterized protein n=1 Tax=Terrapene triunguis TaxID=2587831 RepID=A0A674J2I7_9SAUR